MLDETTTLFAGNVTETFSSQPLLVRKAEKFTPVFKLALFPRLWSAVCICMATTPGDTSEVQRARGMHASQLLIKLVGSRTSDAYANCEQVAPSHPHTLDYTHLSGCCFSTNPRNWSLSKNSLGRFKTVSWFFYTLLTYVLFGRVSTSWDIWCFGQWPSSVCTELSTASIRLLKY